MVFKHDTRLWTGARGLLTAACGIIALVMALNAQAQKPVLAPNASISGEIVELSGLPQRIRSSPCVSRQCSFRGPAINLTLSIPGYGATRVSFPSISDPRFVIRESNTQTLNDSALRPLLLRGTQDSDHRTRPPRRTRPSGIQRENSAIRASPESLTIRASRSGVWRTLFSPRRTG